MLAWHDNKQLVSLHLSNFVPLCNTYPFFLTLSQNCAHCLSVDKWMTQAWFLWQSTYVTLTLEGSQKGGDGDIFPRCVCPYTHGSCWKASHRLPAIRGGNTLYWLINITMATLSKCTLYPALSHFKLFSSLFTCHTGGHSATVCSRGLIIPHWLLTRGRSVTYIDQSGL